MAGLSRTLKIDVARFEVHARELLGRFESGPASSSVLCADVRADAYGHGRDIVEPMLRRSGFANFLGDEGCSSGSDHARHHAIDAVDLYGFRVEPDGTGGLGFSRLAGTVVNVKRVPAGQRISYGYTYATEAESTVALVALGYADGVLRRASNAAVVTVAGAKLHVPARIAGRIAMDQFVADTGDEVVSVGDEVVIWTSTKEPGPSIQELSHVTGVPPLAITSGVGFRVRRMAVNG
jgi:alanine racemase